MTLEKVKQIIFNTNISAGLKNRLNDVLASLEDNCLDGLARELDRKDSNLIAKYLVDLWENFSRIITGLKKADPKTVEDFFGLLSRVDYLTNDDDRLYLLYLVLDVRVIVDNSKFSISSQQYEEILNYEIDLFWHLPKGEIIFLLQNRLLFLESRVNLLEYIKVIIWENDWDYTKNFSKNFSDLLIQNNTEKLGEKTIGTWVHDYFNFSSPSSFRADVVQVAEFLVKDPLVQELDEQERKSLSEILKLYVWFLKPEINEDEVLAYKEEIRAREVEEFEKAIFSPNDSNYKEQNLQKTKPLPPIIPAPKNRLIQKPIQEIVKLAPPPASLAKPVNIEEVLKKKPVEEDQITPGLKMWDSQPPQMGQRIPSSGGAEAILNKKITSPQPSPHPSSRADESALYGAGKERGQTPTVDIDKKLEELKDRTKN